MNLFLKKESKEICDNIANGVESEINRTWNQRHKYHEPVYFSRA